MTRIFIGITCIAFVGSFTEIFATKGEEPIDLYKEMLLAYHLPQRVKTLLLPLVRLILGPRVAKAFKIAKRYSSEEIDELLRDKIRFEREFAERWTAEGLDAMICPVFYHSAYKSTESRNDLAVMADYTQLWNVLHYPAGVVPITEVLKGEDSPDVYRDGFNDVITKACRNSIRDSVGMPINIQVAAPKWKDEECLAIIKVLETVINFKKNPDLSFIDLTNPDQFRSPAAQSLSFLKIVMLLVLSAFMIFAGVMHFKNPRPFLKIMPEWIPFHLEMVYISGVAEILGGAGLLIP